ncbi:1-pyrroline-5-carboxylate dehydrogenase 1 [Nocardia otitidiscaviarum]|uniref:L-glutamate gamma-semialdehyde dehydrogenase n=2 Tax=Nocardia otitidiscaviarum TaxID=1823 RepID=A0A379JLK6_9NOCA|nr:1-pyrroline-5-carboxylate dehydrogenase 1 [Nocardia otitidiscaviarum]
MLILVIASNEILCPISSDRPITWGRFSGLLLDMDAITTVPAPTNEPVNQYAPGSPERARLRTALDTLSAEPTDIRHVIDGVHRTGGGERVDVVQPHRHAAVLGTLTTANAADAQAAVEAATAAAPAWRELPFDERAAVFLRAADLLAGPWRETIAAATMLGQSKTAYQAEIDAPCELVDFWRFNVHFARQILAEQPNSAPGVWNRMDHRPLEGFVYAVTPFNFTAIAGNLPTAPALMGNTVVWKPSVTQAVAAYHTMRLLEAAGLPPGVINLVHGYGPEVSEVTLHDPRLAGIHFTGSTSTFQHLWREVGSRIERYHGYPRLVGETGGKDFVLAHPSADPEALITALIRGAYEYQGQKCSAASRAFVPRSLWARMGDELIGRIGSLTYGDITDFTNFGGAVIDRRAFDRNAAAIERAKATAGLTIAAGGTYDDSVGYFIAPTLLLGDDPTDTAFATEYFGPILALHVYDDSRADAFDEVLRMVDSGSGYALTGAILAQDRHAIDKAGAALRFAAGNFYVNDKPTGAVVGQQPFGGARASGTNDKAGSPLNLLRWTSPRSIKETFVPARSHEYPHQRPESEEGR